MTSENLTNEELFEEFKGTKLYKYKPQFERVETTIDNLEVNWEEIKYDSIKDLIPYYPYIVCLDCFDKESNNSIIALSSESFVDIEERKRLNIYLNEVLRHYNRAKRKKESFNKEFVLSKVCWNHYEEDIYKEIIDRVDKYGKKATIDGLETFMAKYYRGELKEEMNKYEE